MAPVPVNEPRDHSRMMLYNPRTTGRNRRPKHHISDALETTPAGGLITVTIDNPTMASVAQCILFQLP